ncbi:MAG TPA: MBL fold metallo-hydrolase RNA specificity domain-containing protein, partial [Spirochaetota bacterium]|nr:MBL fold metallo-hydrolase RNA specificity domain-containing protein [Spirochaetota bacterium]
DKEGLLDWMSTIKNPKLKVFVVHGEENASALLAEEIRNRFGYTVYVPHWGEIVDLETMKSEYAKYSPFEIADNVESELEHVEKLVQTLKARYKKAKEEGRRINWNQIENDISDIRELVSMINDEL